LIVVPVVLVLAVWAYWPRAGLSDRSIRRQRASMEGQLEQDFRRPDVPGGLGF
jgi:hypothetical protein